MTQTEWVLKNAKKRWITAMDALNGCGCFRLAARIRDLKNDNHTVIKKMIEQNGKHIAAYKVIGAKHGVR